MPVLDLNPDIVRFVIDKVHEFHSREDVTFPEEDEVQAVNEDLAEQFATDFAGDPYYQELMTTIGEVALMWVGRGDYALEEWDEALKFAEENWTDHTADYLVGTPLLADYLAEGLQQFETESEE
jgi:hypothetical protein